MISELDAWKTSNASSYSELAVAWQELLQEREILTEEMEAWQTVQEKQMTTGLAEQLAAELVDETTATGPVENSASDWSSTQSDPFVPHIVGLPSDFSPGERTVYNLTQLASDELLARMALGYDLVVEICEARLIELGNQQATAVVSSSRQASRSATLRRDHHHHIQHLVKIYNLNRGLMLGLGLDQEHPRLRSLNPDTDLVKHSTAEKSYNAQFQVNEGWIWNIAGASLAADSLSRGPDTDYLEEGKHSLLVSFLLCILYSSHGHPPCFHRSSNSMGPAESRGDQVG